MTVPQYPGTLEDQKENDFPLIFYAKDPFFLRSAEDGVKD